LLRALWVRALRSRSGIEILPVARSPPSVDADSLHVITHRRTALTQYGEEIPVEELEQELASELPGRDLLMSITLPAIPMLGFNGLTCTINASGILGSL
jgi:hypothetical protein